MGATFAQNAVNFNAGYFYERSATVSRASRRCMSLFGTPVADPASLRFCQQSVGSETGTPPDKNFLARFQ
jgi:hypothetical protein